MFELTGMQCELSKGQKAMAYAFMFPVASPNGKGFGSPENTQTPSKQLLNKARTVLSHSDEHAYTSDIIANFLGWGSTNSKITLYQHKG